MSNVVPIRPPPPYEPEYTIERERDKLLHVAELLEWDADLYRLKRPHFADEDYCFYCEETQRITRRFRAMAVRIRRFWGAAVQIVTDDRVHEMIRCHLRLLHGDGPVPADPMAELAILREVLALRIENAALRAQLVVARESEK